MDFYISLKVNFRGNAKSFLLSGSETKSWESMEAMVSWGGGWGDVSLITHLDAAKSQLIRSDWSIITLYLLWNEFLFVFFV